MPRSFVAMTLLGALGWLPLGGPASAQANRVRAASREGLATPSELPSKRARVPRTAPVNVEDPRAPERATDEPTQREVEAFAARAIPTEEITERYANGKIKIKRHVIQNRQRNYVNHGPWSMFDPDGNLVVTGNYQLGKRHGAWSRLQDKSWQAEDSPAFKGFTQPFVWDAFYADDLLHGKWTIFDADGRLIRTWEFAQGRLEGQSIDWHPNGKKRRELAYSQGVPQSALQEWDATGKLTGEMAYANGRPTRPFFEKYPTGEKKLEGWCIGKKETVQVTLNWWEGTIRVDRVEGEGKEPRHGHWTAWYLHGGKQYEGTYQHDQPVGPHTFWYFNGQRQSSGHFVNGRETGRWTWWHDNGVRSLEGEYLDGKREGRWTAWHRSGEKSETGIYSAGNKTGQWAHWDEAGKFIDWRDFGDGPPQEAPQVAKPESDAADRDELAPLNSPPGEVPEILQRWRDRNSTKLR